MNGSGVRGIVWTRPSDTDRYLDDLFGSAEFMALLQPEWSGVTRLTLVKDNRSLRYWSLTGARSRELLGRGSTRWNREHMLCFVLFHPVVTDYQLASVAISRIFGQEGGLELDVLVVDDQQRWVEQLLRWFVEPPQQLLAGVMYRSELWPPALAWTRGFGGLSLCEPTFLGPAPRVLVDPELSARLQPVILDCVSTARCCEFGEHAVLWELGEGLSGLPRAEQEELLGRLESLGLKTAPRRRDE